MKKLFFLLILAFCLGACNVDENEITPEENSIQVLNASFQNDGCTVTSFKYGDTGFAEVRNDLDFLYVKIQAAEGFELTETNLHIANSFSEFPTVGKGNLPISKMEHRKTFNPSVRDYTFKIPLDTYNKSIVIATNSTFQDQGSLLNSWAGDVFVKTGNWYYFEYSVNDFPIYVGKDNSTVITESEAAALPSWDEVRKLYSNMLESGVPKNGGTFNPTIWELIYQFQEQHTGDFTTTYTLGSGECIDSAVLTVTVVPDI